MMFLGLRKLGNICVFCVPDTKFVSATNVARGGKRGNICVGNNVSATMCPRLQGPLALGNNSLQESDFPKHNLCEVIKILGIYFGYDVRQRDNLNFRETSKSMKKSVSLWKWTGLSLLGRIQIVKTFAIPKFMFRASVIPTSKELIKDVNSILYSFIWNGKDKVKRHALISEIEVGGLKMLDIDSMISAK